jgi:murein DD-endopeptidase MepM/ murein hydrolase activator NlpD
MAKSKFFSVLVVPDGVEQSYGIKLRAWLFKTLVVLSIITFISLVIFFAFYSEVLVRASEASRLKIENEELKRYKYKLRLLEQNMKETRSIVGRISALAGVDFEIPELPPDSVIFAEMGKTKQAVMPGTKQMIAGYPSGLPFEGYVTRGFSDDPGDYHPGIDIAGEIGTPIMATAAGVVTYAGTDSIYGEVVVINHDNELSTLYGHNSEVLVEIGQEVFPGNRIALLGNTGKSTAPHLHYELRNDKKPVNPLNYIMENEILSKQE